MFNSPRLQDKWLFCLLVSLCALALTYWPHGLFLFRYERVAFAAGQPWRMASAHLTHLNTAHLLFNLAGLFLLCELLWQDLPVRHGAGLLAVAGSGVSLLLWWLQPEVAWYAGLSGALHGLWAGCALAGIRPRTAQPDSRSHVAGAAGIALLALKLALEYRYGASSHTARAIGAPVLVVSHWYGALSGACYVMVWRLVRRLRRGTDSAPHFD